MKPARFEWLRSESYRSGICYSCAFNVVAKLLAFAVSVLIAFRYGTGDDANVYFYAFGTVSLLAGFARGMNAAVLIPEAMRMAEQESPARSMAFLNAFLYLLCALGGAGSLLLLADPVRFFLAISTFDAAALAPHRALLAASAPLFLLMTVAFFLTDVLVARKFFTAPMILSSLNSVVVIAAVLALRPLGVTGIVIGLQAAFGLQCVLLAALMKSTLGWRFGLVAWRHRGKVWRDLAYAQLGNAASAFSGYVPLMLLGGLGQGLIAALNYARSVVELPDAFLSAQFSAVAGIKLNEVFARREWREVDRVFQSTARLLTFLVLPLGGLLFLYSHELIELLFARGRFAAASVDVSAELLRYLSPLVVLSALNTLQARLFMAGQLISVSFWVQLALGLLTAASIAAGIRRFGYLGVPAARVAVMALNVTAIGYALLRVFVPMVRYGRTLGYVGGLVALNAAVCGLLLWLGAHCPLSGLARMAAGGALYAGLVLAANAALGLNPEVTALARQAALRLAGREART